MERKRSTLVENFRKHILACTHLGRYKIVHSSDFFLKDRVSSKSKTNLAHNKKKMNMWLLRIAF